MVRTRVLFGAVLIVVVVGLVALDAWLTQQILPDWPWLSGSVIGIGCDFLLLGALLTGVVALLVGWGVVEMGRLCRAAGHQPAVRWACLASVVLIILPWLTITPVLGNRSPLAEWQVTGQWLAVSLVVSAVLILMRGEPKGAMVNMALTGWMIVYIGFLGSFFSRIRIDLGGPLGAWAVLYAVSVVKFTDIGAYFTGVSIGRHKVVPSVSPNKTLEGFVGGLVTAIVIAVAFSHLGGIIVPLGRGMSHGPWLSTGRAVVFGLTIGVVGQIGDLIESLIKRDAQIKDSGTLVPTFGGVLDIIDSPLLAAPLAWWLLTGWLG